MHVRIGFAFWLHFLKLVTLKEIISCVNHVMFIKACNRLHWSQSKTPWEESIYCELTNSFDSVNNSCISVISSKFYFLVFSPEYFSVKFLNVWLWWSKAGHTWLYWYFPSQPGTAQQGRLAEKSLKSLFKPYTKVRIYTVKESCNLRTIVKLNFEHVDIFVFISPQDKEHTIYSRETFLLLRFFLILRVISGTFSSKHWRA